MENKEETGHPLFPPLSIITLVMVCLALVLAPSLLSRIIDLTMAILIIITVVSLTFAVITTLYTKRLSFLSVVALFTGMLFFASGVTCYTLGVFPIDTFFGNRISCYWGLFPNQKSHGFIMLALGLLTGFVAFRSIMAPKAKGHVERVFEYVLLGLGVIQSFVGTLGIMVR